MRKLLTVPALLLLAIHCFGQNTATVSGSVTDSRGMAIPSASVGLYQLKDSSLSRIVLTSGTGQFEIKTVLPGKYFISVTSVGYKKGSVGFELRGGQSFFLSPIPLVTDHSRLGNVNVEGKKPLVEVTADKTILNVESSVNASGSNAFELLQKSPGVTVDKDDNISLKGKNGVRIYIDGKPSPTAGKDLAEFLRSVNSDDLEAIEIISNPSAKYDAAGNAGIINLRLKKNRNFGTNGSITMGGGFGYSPKANSAFNINHRDQSVNIFGNYSNNFGKRRSLFDLYREQNDTVYDQHTTNFSDPHIHNFKAGLDIFLNAKNTLGFLATGNFNNATYSNDGYANIMKKGLTAPQKILYATGVQHMDRSNLNYNVNYRFAGNKGNELLIDADLGQFRSRAQSTQPNYYKTPSGSLLQEKIYRNNTPTDIDIETLKLDYEFALGKGKLGLGGKYSNVKTKNIFDFFNVVSGTSIKDSGRSNTFNYRENINAGYINYSSPLGKRWSMRAGVRMENTVSEGNLISFHPQPDDKVKRNYTDLFPSAAFSYTANAKNSFSFSYSRRIDRPNYEDLNPFENKIDELTYQKGNAFLRPQYSNIFEITHSWNARLNSTLSYSHIKDFRTNIIDTTEKNRVFRTVKNLASQDIYNFNIAAPLDLTKWWKFYVTANGYHSLYKADFGNNKKLDVSIFAWNLYAQQTFTILEGLTLELSGFYNSPTIWSGSFETKPLYAADAGLQKLLFAKRGSLRISYTDVFETIHFRGISDFGGAYLDVRGRSESTQLKVNFTYRFGNSQVKGARQRKTGLDEEINRINTTQ